MRRYAALRAVGCRLPNNDNSQTSHIRAFVRIRKIRSEVFITENKGVISSKFSRRAIRIVWISISGIPSPPELSQIAFLWLRPSPVLLRASQSRGSAGYRAAPTTRNKQHSCQLTPHEQGKRLEPFLTSERRRFAGRSAASHPASRKERELRGSEVKGGVQGVGEGGEERGAAASGSRAEGSGGAHSQPGQEPPPPAAAGREGRAAAELTAMGARGAAHARSGSAGVAALCASCDGSQLPEGLSF